MHHVASRLASDTPLFIIGDDCTVNDSLICVANEECRTSMKLDALSGVVIVASPEGDSAVGNSTRSASMGTTLDVPTLVLDVYGNNNTINASRYNPNAIAVRLGGGKVEDKDSWLASCVLHFIDASVRLRDTRNDVSDLRARL